MQTRKLGTSGIDVSIICLGTMNFGEQNSEAEGHQQMDYAVSRGVNFLDTAEIYAVPPKPETQGRTEEIIGSWFQARKNRDKVILATKVAGRSMMTWLRDDKSPTRLNRAQMTEALEKSLKRLKTDYIDLYQVHFPERPLATKRSGTFQPVFFSVSMICSFSTSSSFDAGIPMPLFDSGIFSVGIHSPYSNDPFRLKIIARSMIFSSSRTLPGH